MKNTILFAILIFSISLFSEAATYAQTQKAPDTSKKAQKDSLNSIASIQALITRNRYLDSINQAIKKSNLTQALLKKENDALQKRLDSLNGIVDKTNTNIQVLARDSIQLKKNIAKLDSINAQLQKQQTIYQDSVNTIKDYVDKLKRQKQTLQKDTTKLHAAKKNLQSSTDSLVKTAQAVHAIIAKQKDSLEVVASITMNDKVDVFKAEGAKSYTTKVQSVYVLVKEGFMLEIVAVTDSGVFRNRFGIIDLLHFSKHRQHHLAFENPKSSPDQDNLFIYLGDVISYIPCRSYSDVPYMTFEKTLTPAAADKTFLLRESTSINSYIDVSAFTDIQGISGSPNGLAQFSADAKFITNTKNKDSSSLVYLNYFSFTGGLAIYDNKFSGTQVYGNDSVSRINLLQRATYQVGVKLNLLRVFPSPYPHSLFDNVELNVGFNFIGTNVFVTGFKDAAKTVPDSTSSTVTQNMWYIVPLVTLSRHKNFSLTISAPFDMVSIKQSADIKNFHNEFWTCPSIDLMFFGKQGKVFFRYHYYINLNNPSQAFNQMQLGYSLNLTSVWRQKQTN